MVEPIQRKRTVNCALGRLTQFENWLFILSRTKNAWVVNIQHDKGLLTKCIVKQLVIWVLNLFFFFILYKFLLSVVCRTVRIQIGSIKFFIVSQKLVLMLKNDSSPLIAYHQLNIPL